MYSRGFPGGSADEESAYSVGDLGSILGLGRSPGEGKGYPLQYSGLEIPWTVKSMGSKRVGHERAPFTHSLFLGDTLYQHTYVPSFLYK